MKWLKVQLSKLVHLSGTIYSCLIGFVYVVLPRVIAAWIDCREYSHRTALRVLAVSCNPESVYADVQLSVSYKDCSMSDPAESIALTGWKACHVSSVGSPRIVCPFGCIATCCICLHTLMDSAADFSLNDDMIATLSLKNVRNASSIEEKEIRKDLEDGRDYGVSGTPGFFVGNDEIGYVELKGAQPFESFKKIIDAQLGV